jgi:hypothetical protein
MRKCDYSESVQGVLMRFETCLYCEKVTGSREHILASSIGGHLDSWRLICAEHNVACGKYADGPLCQQFEFAVHCLEVLRGDGVRGTTWRCLNAKNDSVSFNVSPDFKYNMRKTKVEKDGDGFLFSCNVSRYKANLLPAGTRS